MTTTTWSDLSSEGQEITVKKTLLLKDPLKGENIFKETVHFSKGLPKKSVKLFWRLTCLLIYTLWQTNMAIENGPFEDVFRVEHDMFHYHVCLPECK